MSSSRRLSLLGSACTTTPRASSLACYHPTGGGRGVRRLIGKVALSTSNVVVPKYSSFYLVTINTVTMFLMYHRAINKPKSIPSPLHVSSLVLYCGPFLSPPPLVPLLTLADPRRPSHPRIQTDSLPPDRYCLTQVSISSVQVSDTQPASTDSVTTHG